MLTPVKSIGLSLLSNSLQRTWAFFHPLMVPNGFFRTWGVLPEMVIFFKWANHFLMHDFCWASHLTKALRPWRRCHRWRMEHWNLMLRRCWRRRLCPRWGFFLGWKGWEVHEIWGLNHEGHVGGRLRPCWGQVGALMGPYWGHGPCGGRGGLCWGNVWAKLRACRAMWRHLGAMSRLLVCWASLGARWAARGCSKNCETQHFLPQPMLMPRWTMLRLVEAVLDMLGPCWG